MNEENGGKPALTRPMTTEEYFNKICDILKQKNLMPDIMDYALATHDPIRHCYWRDHGAYRLYGDE